MKCIHCGVPIKETQRGWTHYRMPPAGGRGTIVLWEFCRFTKAEPGTETP